MGYGGQNWIALPTPPGMMAWARLASTPEVGVLFTYSSMKLDMMHLHKIRVYSLNHSYFVFSINSLFISRGR
jgi:hypothetical protein